MSGEIEWECENCGTRLYAADPRACPECDDPLLTPVELDVVDEGDGESRTERFDVDQATARLEELKDAPAKRRASSGTAASRSADGRPAATAVSSESSSGRSSRGSSSGRSSNQSSSLAQFVATVFGLLVVLLAIYIVVQAGLVP
ncbi:hypothetical protein ACFQH6_15000 [Halobacteriaceae archaeon GCM10025711]